MKRATLTMAATLTSVGVAGAIGVQASRRDEAVGSGRPNRPEKRRPECPFW